MLLKAKRSAQNTADVKSVNNAQNVDQDEGLEKDKAKTLAMAASLRAASPLPIQDTTINQMVF